MQGIGPISFLAVVGIVIGALYALFREENIASIIKYSVVLGVVFPLLYLVIMLLVKLIELLLILILIGVIALLVIRFAKRML